jgi:hypothetical protein
MTPLRKLRITLHDDLGAPTEERYAVLGPAGAVEWHVAVRPADYPHADAVSGGRGLISLGVEIHSREPRHEGQRAHPCMLLAGLCYPDGSSTWGRSLFDMVVHRDGIDECMVWVTLVDAYRERFGAVEE